MVPELQGDQEADGRKQKESQEEESGVAKGEKRQRGSEARQEFTLPETMILAG